VASSKQLHFAVAPVSGRPGYYLLTCLNGTNPRAGAKLVLPDHIAQLPFGLAEALRQFLKPSEAVQHSYRIHLDQTRSKQLQTQLQIVTGLVNEAGYQAVMWLAKLEGKQLTLRRRYNVVCTDVSLLLSLSPAYDTAHLETSQIKDYRYPVGIVFVKPRFGVRRNKVVFSVSGCLGEKPNMLLAMSGLVRPFRDLRAVERALGLVEGDIAWVEDTFIRVKLPQGLSRQQLMKVLERYCLQAGHEVSFWHYWRLPFTGIYIWRRPVSI
jgi:hypothetical protein